MQVSEPITTYPAPSSQPRLCVLFLLHGPVPLQTGNRFQHLATQIDGDVLQPVGRSGPAEKELFDGSGMRLHQALTWNKWPRFRLWRELVFYLREGIRLSRHRDYDAIIAFGTTKSALAGFILSRLTKTKFMIEVPVRLERIYLMNTRYPDLRARGKSCLTCLLGSLLLPTADRLHLMYPGQVDNFRASRHIAQTAFPDFVPIASLPGPTAKEQRTILALGTPLYLKGADFVIHAFHRLADEFSDVRLVVAGQVDDEHFFEQLVANHPRITLVGHVDQQEAWRLIANATVVVIASRTDAMPRVAVEAMALSRPVVAARVDGLATYLEDGHNSLLVRGGDVGELERAVRKLLADPKFAAALGSRARDKALAHFSEAAYTSAFVTMVHEMVRGDRSTVSLRQQHLPGRRT